MSDTIATVSPTTIETAQPQPQVETANVAKKQQPKAPKAQAQAQGRVLPVTQPKVVELQPIAEGESANRATVVDEAKKTVVSNYAFKLSDKDTNRYQKTTTFDFSQCTLSEILELATATVRIVTQRNLRSLGKGALNSSVYAAVNVKNDILNATKARESVDDTTRAIRALMAAANMSHEAALAMVEGAKKGNLKS